jgi:hypothetical protein
MSKTMLKLVFAVGLFVTVLVSGVQAMAAPPGRFCRIVAGTCVECATGCNPACTLCVF